MRETAHNGWLSPVCSYTQKTMGELKTIPNTNRTKTGKNSPVRLTKKLINEYRDSLLSRGCKEQTVNMYCCYLNKLYDFLPSSKELTETNLVKWVNDLFEKGLSDRTVNLYLSSANGVLKYCGRKKVPMSSISAPRDAEVPELTREEYLRLLSCAKEEGSERDYLIIRTLATIDIELVELPYVTVESCQKGFVEFPDHKETVIPDSLRHELLIYIQKQAIHRGPVFLSRNDSTLDRTNITHMIERMGKEAGIAPGKCNSRGLHRLYQKTQDEINTKLMSVYTKAYDQLLDEEQNKMKSIS